MSALRRLLPALCVGLLAIADGAAAQLISPGPLSQDHHELEGDERCSDCHSSGRRIAQNKCLDCHKDLRRSVVAGRGLHGREWRGKDCGECHVEHLGRKTRLVRWPPDGPPDFDHTRTGHRLRGAHRDLKCRDCHNKRNRWGGRTFLKLSKRCITCHEDEHRGRLGEDCQSCHSERDWKDVDLNDFDHSRARFPLRGKHRSVECVKCHHDPPTYHPLRFRTCANCHRDPHRGELGPNCKGCHTERGWLQLGKVRSEHPWLSLANGHEGVRCRTCHDRGLDRGPSNGRECVGCHSPVHKADFGEKCDQCHRDVRWVGLPEDIGRRAHPKTSFPLVGAHVKVACRSCHAPDRPQDQRYRGIDHDRCADCHRDPHKGRWSASALLDMDCGDCHWESSFWPGKFGPTLHRNANFALDGKHVAVPCAACHKKTRRRPRLVWSMRGGDTACVDCHENPHGDQFQEEMERGGCGACHSVLGWESPNVDHSIWPLTGAHAETACESCHSPSAEDRRRGRGASYRGVPRECVACHGEAHAGQFRLSDPVRACDFCHETQAFDIPYFDHADLARYPLEGRHRDVECAGCHPTERLPDWGAVVRYRLGYRECRHCHADPHSGGR